MKYLGGESFEGGVRCLGTYISHAKRSPTSVSHGELWIGITYSGASGYGGHPPSSITEDIYPVHALDDTKTFRMFINWTMCFNDVLDPEKLHNSLSRVLNIGDWRKLGGRLRVKV